LKAGIWKHYDSSSRKAANILQVANVADELRRCTNKSDNVSIYNNIINITDNATKLACDNMCMFIGTNKMVRNKNDECINWKETTTTEIVNVRVQAALMSPSARPPVVRMESNTYSMDT